MDFLSFYLFLHIPRMPEFNIFSLFELQTHEIKYDKEIRK